VLRVNNAQQRVQVKVIPRFQEEDSKVRAQQKFFVPIEHGLQSHRDNSGFDSHTYIYKNKKVLFKYSIKMVS